MRLLCKNIDNFDVFGVAVPSFTAKEWDAEMPPWDGKDEKRGPKNWGSKAQRGRWRVSCLNHKCINSAVGTYMDTLAVPPVATKLPPGPTDLDYVRGFFYVIRKCYCKYLIPEVESGTDAYERVLQYMLTEPVKLKLLRAVSFNTPCQHTLSTCMINTPSQYILSIHNFKVCDQHTFSTHTFNMCDQHSLSKHTLFYLSTLYVSIEFGFQNWWPSNCC